MEIMTVTVEVPGRTGMRGSGLYSQNADMLVISLGFATAVQPKAIQGAIFHVRR